MHIIQNDSKNDESQFIFPYKLVTRSLPCVIPPYVVGIPVAEHPELDLKVMIEECIKRSEGLAREMQIINTMHGVSLLVVRYVHDRDKLLHNIDHMKSMLVEIFGIEIKNKESTQ